MEGIVGIVLGAAAVGTIVVHRLVLKGLLTKEDITRELQGYLDAPTPGGAFTNPLARQILQMAIAAAEHADSARQKRAETDATEPPK
jgi:hypothetical protein